LILRVLEDDEIMREDIRVTCKVSDFLPLDSIEEFQGGFKKRDRYDIENIKKSLLKYGVTFPFFIWECDGVNYCLDGHGRRLALTALREQGLTVPPLPVVYILAKDRKEAAQKLLYLNSRYGAITEESLAAFIGDLSVDFSELSIPELNIDFKLSENLETFFSDEEKPKEKKLKRCPYCGGVLK
jgi:hypothetical protein